MFPKKLANVTGFLNSASKISAGRESRRAAAPDAFHMPPTKTVSVGTEQTKRSPAANFAGCPGCLAAHKPTANAVPADNGTVSSKSTRIGATTVFDQTKSRYRLEAHNRMNKPHSHQRPLAVRP